jgi:hypothetical protein
MLAALLCVCAYSMGYTVEARAGRDDDIKLTGCLIRGEQGAGYLLTNAPGDLQGDVRHAKSKPIARIGGPTWKGVWISSQRRSKDQGRSTDRIMIPPCRTIASRNKSPFSCRPTG